MDRGQPLVPGGDPAPPLLLQVAQELPYAVRRHVLDGQAIDRLSGAPGDSREQQPQGVAVAPLGIAGEVPFAGDVLRQEPANPRSQQRNLMHDWPPRGRTARIECRPDATTPGSWSDRPGWPPDGHGPGTRTGDTRAVVRPPPADTMPSAGGPRMCGAYAELGIIVIMPPPGLCRLEFAG